MAKDHLSGKLAVILHADVADSTALVQQDKELAHARIQDAFKRFSTAIEKYQGHVVELRGDALLAEFGRASDAVSAALSFQADHAYHISRLKDDLRPTVRVGIATGEVIIDDNTVTGAGVVQAQRIEQLADPGGVCISAAIHDALSKRMPFDLENLGEQELKGFDYPVRVYRVELSTGESIPIPQQPIKNNTPSGKPRLMVVTIVVALLVVGGATYWIKKQEPNVEVASIERMAFPLPDKPSIAVLPFTNMSGVAEQEYFADGITENLITDLSKISTLFVIARNSSFSYKGQQVKVRQVAEDLGVRYVMEGSVQRAGDQVRINAQLIDATSGGHIWAERYDGSLDDVFSMQDKITRNIVTALVLTLATDLGETQPVNTGNAEAYDAYLRGWEQFRLGNPDAFARSIEYFQQALVLDPTYSEASTALAAVYWSATWRRWIRSDDMLYSIVVNRSREYLKKAMKSPSALTYQVASEMSAYFHRKASKSLIQAELAITLDKNDPSGYIALANALLKDGRPDEAVTAMHSAMRLDPRYPGFYLTRLGRAHFDLGKYQLAAETFERATKINPEDDRAYMFLVATYGYLGNMEKASASISAVNRLRVKIGKGRLKLDEISYIGWLGDRKRLREGLKLAGTESGYEWRGLVTGNGRNFVNQGGVFDVEGAIKIDVRAAKQLHDRGVTFLDTYITYSQYRIPGAYFLNWFRQGFGRQREVNETRLLELVDKSEDIVVYSSSENISVAAHTAAYAVANGFKKVYYFEGGLDAWKKAGYPVDTDKK